MDLSGQPLGWSEPVFALRPVVEAARLRGTPIDGPLRAAGFGPFADRHPEERIPLPVAVEVWRQAARLGRLFALEAAVNIPPDRSESPLAMYGAVAPNVGESARRLVEVSAAGSQLVRWRLDDQGDDWWVVAVATRPPCPGMQACIEYMMGDALAVGRWHAGQAFGMEAELAHPGPTEPFARVFQAPVRFGAAQNRLRLTPTLRALPCPRADATLSAILGKRIHSTLAALDAHPTIERLAPLLRATQPVGTLTLEAAATALGASPSTLQRRLRAEGTTYRDLIDRVRRDLAFELLLRPDARPGEIAYATGFSEPRAFTRAFRRWTGQTPSTWRGGR